MSHTLPDFPQNFSGYKQSPFLSHGSRSQNQEHPATGHGEVSRGPAPDHHNQVRLHSAIGYIAPMDKLLGKDVKIFKERDRKLESAREERKQRRRSAAIN